MVKVLFAAIALSLLEAGVSISPDESWSDSHHLYRRSVPKPAVNTSDNETMNPPHFDPGLFFMCPNDPAEEAYQEGGIAPCLFDISKMGDSQDDEGQNDDDLAAANCELRFEEANNTRSSAIQKRARGGGRSSGMAGGPLGLCLNLLSGLGGGKSKGKGFNPKVPSGGRPSGGRPSGGRPSGGRPSGGRPSEGRPSRGRPSGGRPSGGRPSGGRPSGGRPSGGRPSGGHRPQGPSGKGSNLQAPPHGRPVPGRHPATGHSQDHPKPPPLKRGMPVPSERSYTRDTYDTRKPVQSQNGVSVYQPKTGKGPYRAEVDVDPKRYPGNARAFGQQSRAYPQTVAQDQFPGKGFPRTGGQGFFDPRSGRVVYGNGRPAPVTQYHPSQVPPEIRAQAAKNGNKDGIYAPAPAKKGTGDYAKQGGQWAMQGGKWVLHNAWNLNMLQGMGRDLYYAVKPKTMKYAPA